jgi:hypothetical protein
MKMRLSATYCVALMMLACPNDVFAANPDNGSILVQRWCTGCHVVSGEQIKGTDIAPSFASISERPDFNAGKIASFLLEPEICQRSMEVEAADKMQASDLAKVRFCENESVKEWSLHADRVHVTDAEFPS